MSTMVWKALALFGVIGAGGAVMWQAQKSLNAPTETVAEAKDFEPVDLDDLEGTDPAGALATASETTSPESETDVGDLTDGDVLKGTIAEAETETESTPFKRPPTRQEESLDTENPFGGVVATPKPASPAVTAAAHESEATSPWELEDTASTSGQPEEQQELAADEATTAEPAIGKSSVPSLPKTTAATTEADDSNPFGSEPAAAPEHSEPAGSVALDQEEPAAQPEPLKRLDPDNTGPVLMSPPGGHAAEPEDNNPFGGAVTAESSATDEKTTSAETTTIPTPGPAADAPRSSIPPMPETKAVDDEPAGRVDFNQLSSIPQREPEESETPAATPTTGIRPSKAPELPNFSRSETPKPNPETSSQPAEEESTSPFGLALPKVNQTGGQQSTIPSATPAVGSTIPRASAPPVDNTIANDHSTLPPATPATAAPAKAARSLDLVGDGVINRDVAQGPSQPQLTITKQAPKEAVVGQDLEYSIIVRNVGRTAAASVTVEDQIPRGSECTGTAPKSEIANKTLKWKLGTLAPGDEKILRVRVTPTAAGEIGSIATVSFAAEVAAKTTIIEPKANIAVTGPSEVVVGEPGQFKLTLTNNGAADLKNVVVRSLLPDGLDHASGRDLQYEVGDLPRGKSKDVNLTLQGVKPGAWQPQVLMTHNGRELGRSTADINVIEARIVVSRTGPANRFVGRGAEYINTVTNRSGNPLMNVTVTESVPAGVDPSKVGGNGKWDPNRRTITWFIQQLVPGDAVPLPLTLTARQSGTLEGKVTATDSAGSKAEVATMVAVRGFSSLSIGADHDGAPISVGEQASMRFVVKNRGSAPAERVQVQFELPEEVKFVNANGPAAFERDGNLITFKEVPSVAAQGELKFDVVFQAVKATPASGEKRVRVSLHSSQLPDSQPLVQDQPVVVLDEELSSKTVLQTSGTR
jgi:uncharacterized repeat protein (TIGR01451 family)